MKIGFKQKISKIKLLIKPNFILLFFCFSGLVFLLMTSRTPFDKSRNVELRSDGFFPKELKIHSGESIRFITRLSKPFWPASNIHPYHTIYPEFDPKEPISPGKSWTFRFDKVGEWEYHDHLNPNFVGKIIVWDENSQIAEDSKDRCNSLEKSKKSQCWEKEIDRVLKENGVDASLNLLAKFYEQEPAFSQECHGLTHKIGTKAYDLFSKKVEFVLSPKAAYCAYGFYHGFMEQLLIKTADLKQAQEFCDYVDQQLASQTSDAKLQCYHGIGHGTATFHDESVSGNEGAIIKPALSLCEKVSTTDDQLYRCASGVFNAIAIFYRSGEYNLPLDKNDPMRVCRNLASRYKDSCYGNMNTLIVWLTNNDLRKGAKFIEDMEDDTFAKSAIRYLSGASISSKIDDKTFASTLVDDCQGLQERLKEPCIEGIAHGLMEHGQPGVEYVEALNFCHLKNISQSQREKCFAHTINYFDSLYTKEKISQICLSIEEQYKKFCR